MLRTDWCDNSDNPGGRNTVPDLKDIDELEQRRRKRTAERAGLAEDSKNPNLETRGSGEVPRPHGRPTAGGADDPEHRIINGHIRSTEIRLIAEDGSQFGIVTTKRALEIARARGLSLFLLQPGANPPVARLMDYGKFKLESEKRSHEIKKKHHVAEVKEITMRYTIDSHDFELKLRAAKLFLQDGDKVKVLTILRGREIQHIELAMELMQKFAHQLKDLAAVERQPKLEGRGVTMILSPAS